MPLATHRRKCASMRGGSGTGGCRFFVARPCLGPGDKRCRSRDRRRNGHRRRPGDAVSDGASPRAAVEAKQNETGEVAQRALVGANLPAFVLDPGAPSGPRDSRQHTRSRAAVLPSRVSQRSRGAPLGGQGDTHHAPVQSLLGVMIDGGAQILEIAACATGTTADADVFTAGFAGDVGQLLAPQIVVQTLNTGFELRSRAWRGGCHSQPHRPRGRRRRRSIRYRALCGMVDSCARYRSASCAFGCCNLRRKASRGEMADRHR